MPASVHCKTFNFPNADDLGAPYGRQCI